MNKTQKPPKIVMVNGGMYEVLVHDTENRQYFVTGPDETAPFWVSEQEVIVKDLTIALPPPAIVTLTWNIAKQPANAPGPSLSQRIWNILLEDGMTTEWQHDRLRELFTFRTLLGEWLRMFSFRKLFKINYPSKQPPERQ